MTITTPASSAFASLCHEASKKERPARRATAGSRSRWRALARVVALATTTALLLSAMALIRPPAASAADLFVTTFDDVMNPTDQKCSLREAISAADFDVQTSPQPGECPAGSGPDRILLAPGTYRLSGTLPAIQTEIEIVGIGFGASAVIDAEDNGGVFVVASSGDLTVENVTIQGGQTSGNGGGIHSQGVLTVIDATVSGNTAGGSGGGIFNDGGTVTVTDSTVEANVATVGAGIYSLDGPASITGSTISANRADVAAGGLYNDGGAMTIVNSTVSGNIADTRGGGIQTRTGGLTMTFSTVSENSAPFAAGVSSKGDDATSTSIGASLVVGNVGGGADLDLFDPMPDADSYLSASFNVLGTLGTTVSAFGSTTGDVTGQLVSGLAPLGPDGRGGATEVHLILDGAMAVDRVTGPVTVGVDATVDQTGFPRPGGAKDAGAVEGLGLSPVLCEGRLVTINLETNGGSGVGTAFADVIRGTNGDDTIDALGGNDTVCGRQGDDVIAGGPGVNRLVGNAGHDTISGGDDVDRIWGGDGHDEIIGGGGNDVLRGNGGGDRIWGGEGDDRLFGNIGDDVVLGENGNDRLFGNAGLDELVGGDGDDALYGHDGPDRMRDGPGHDLLNGGPGDDQLHGSAGEDVLRGGADDDVLVGGSEDDLLVGQGGDDTLIGGDGADDVCRGGSGSDSTDASCERQTGIP